MREFAQFSDNIGTSGIASQQHVIDPLTRLSDADSLVQDCPANLYWLAAGCIDGRGDRADDQIRKNCGGDIEQACRLTHIVGFVQFVNSVFCIAAHEQMKSPFKSWRQHNRLATPVALVNCQRTVVQEGSEYLFVAIAKNVVR